LTRLSQYRIASWPDSVLANAQSTLCWFEASWTFVPDSVAIETAKAENISTNIIDMMSTAPRRFSRTDFFTGAIFPLRKTHHVKEIFNDFSVT
jgi:hypothetical protein